MSTTLDGRKGLLDRLPFDRHLLNGPLRRFLIGTFFGAMGVGLILPFFVIYCTKIRHFAPLESTALLAWEAIVGIAIAPKFGTLIDRFGPSPIMSVSMPLSCVAVVGIAFASTWPAMLGVTTAFALIGAGMWSAFSTLLSRIVVEEHRPDAFGLNFMILNLGIGIGVAIGGVIANLHSLHSFQLLYLFAAGLMLVQAATWFTLRHHGGPAPAEAHEGKEHEGWREVLHDRRLLRLFGFSMLMMVCGYGSIEAGLPYFIVNFAHQSTHVVTLVFIFNTATIVVGMIVALGAIRGRSRSLILCAVGLCWGLSWLFATASLYVGALAGAIGLCVGQIVFATGETLYQPISGPLINDLAPEHLRGRYNSLAGILWGASGAAGQLIAGAFIELDMPLAWTLFVAVGAILGGLGLTTMRRVLTPEQDGRLPAATT